MVEDKNTPVISSQFVLSTGILYIKLKLKRACRKLRCGQNEIGTRKFGSN